MKVGHWHHKRFFIAFVAGGAVLAGAVLFVQQWQILILLGANSFFLAYLGLAARLATLTSAKDLKRQAASDDEGIVVIVCLAIAAVIVSLVAIVWVIIGQNKDVWQSLLAFSAVPLGWGTIHTLAAFRYAHLYYSTKAGGGLEFPATKEPGIWDFLYLSFGIGMTAQVSDVVVTGSGIRKMVLGHSVGAFFYNTVILAFAVNAAITLGG